LFAQIFPKEQQREANKIAEWTIDPAKFCNTAIDNIEKVRRIYAFEIFSRVVKRTPVDTGNARSNWLVSVNQPSEEYTPPTVTKRKMKRGKNKGKTVTKITPHQTLGRTMQAGDLGITFSGDDTIYIQNNTPYIRKLEYGGYGKYDENGNLIQPSNGPRTINGYSISAPQGMVGIVLAQAERMFLAAVNAVKGGGT
jgi:hypothetical protein